VVLQLNAPAGGGRTKHHRDLSTIRAIPIPFTGGSIDIRIACIPLGLAANGVGIIAAMVEVLDDSETGERLDATAACAQEMGGEIQEVRALVEHATELLLTPQGRRPGF
jgi:hypothetical protein